MEAGLVGLVGVVVGAVLTNGIARLLELRKRHDRTLDIVTALHAEVSASLGPTALQTSEAEVAYALNDDVPFAAADDTNFVFDAIKSDISILPNRIIYPVVLYYRLAQQTNIMTSDIRHPLFQQQSKAEKQKYMRSLVDLMQKQERAAFDLLSELERFASSYQIDLGQRASGSNIMTTQLIRRKDE